MRTIRTKIYSFNELSKESQANAIENYRNNNLDHDFIYNEAYDSVKAFNELFNTKEGRNSWLNVYTDHINDEILELTGLRLQKYILNNFGYKLFKGKYYSLWSKKEKSFKYHKEGFPVLKQRYSRVIKNETSCVLTGVCYDDDILQPIYDFLELRSFDSTNFYHLLNNCFDSLKKSIDNEINYRNTDECIIEEIEANEYEFLKDGTQF